MPARHFSRRDFLRGSSTAAGVAMLSGGVFSQLAAEESKSANEKLNIACIGTANQATFTLSNVNNQTIVALCDIDDNLLNSAAAKYKVEKKYNDFRKMLDELEKSIDAVTVCTPDHIHAPASGMALRMGKHVYCEKPLTHTVHEARVLAQLAKEKKLATQMGTQIHAGGNYRRVVEIVQSGAIGPIHEVQVWVGKGWGGGERPKDTPAVPSNLHWDLWVGPAPDRPYHGTYQPANWRRWWDFGGGTLGDMGCHYIDLVFWALGLRHPTTISAEGPAVHAETAPLGLTAHWEFPAIGDKPAVKMTWRDGNHTPKEVMGHKVPGAGVMFIGRDGQLFADYGGWKLYPTDKFADYKQPAKSIPNSIGHHKEWIKACKDGSPTTCNFDYSGALTETVLLGNVAYRAGEKITWDAANLKVTNSDKAQAYIQRAYRQGWKL